MPIGPSSSLPILPLRCPSAPGGIFQRVRASDVKYLVDAGPLVGAFWPADQWHRWSRQTLASLGCPVHTTKTILAEAAHHLKASLPALLQILAAVDAGLILLITVFPLRIGRAAELIVDYKPRGDNGDASLLILSEQFPEAKLITIDRADFMIYRRKDGLPVPCIMPPGA